MLINTPQDIFNVKTESIDLFLAAGDGSIQYIQWLWRLTRGIIMIILAATTVSQLAGNLAGPPLLLCGGRA